MDMVFLFKGLIIGFLIAVPVGPVGVLCIHRTLTEGRIYGLISGLGAAAADAIYGAIAALGLTFVSSFLVEQQSWFRAVGAVFLCGIGVKTVLSKTTKKLRAVNSQSFAAYCGSAFFLTLMNPITILAFAAVFAGVGITGSRHGSASLLIAGVFAGSAIWWILLTGATDLFRRRISEDNLAWLNRISGVIITAFGLFLLVTLII